MKNSNVDEAVVEERPPLTPNPIIVGDIVVEQPKPKPKPK
jgi:hypothetical protein